MRDDDEILATPGLEFGSGVVGVCDICHKRQAVIILEKERYQLCVIDFLNKTFIDSHEKPGRPLPPYRSERVWYETDAVPGGKAPAILLSPTKPVKRPAILVAPDIYGLTTTLLDAGIRFAREGFEVLLPDVGKTAGVGPADHLSLRSGVMFGGGVGIESPRVRHLTALYRDALRFVRGREIVDATKGAIFGASFGAALATAVAAEDRSTTALVLAYPVPVKPVEFLKLLTCPVFVVSGTADRRGVAGRAQFADAGQRGEIQVSFLDLEGARHGFLARDLSSYDVRSAEAAWAGMIRFMRSRLLPPPPKPPAPPKTQTSLPPVSGTPAPSAGAPRPAAPA
ncbi:MAG TPA: dienelactone hydrolase family protein [Thermoplasmata archaeon]|nr:dienelactone hydrolase family protein [Thermoplasmata archaeon]